MSAAARALVVSAVINLGVSVGSEAQTADFGALQREFCDDMRDRLTTAMTDYVINRRNIRYCATQPAREQSADQRELCRIAVQRMDEALARVVLLGQAAAGAQCNR